MSALRNTLKGSRVMKTQDGKMIPPGGWLSCLYFSKWKKKVHQQILPHSSFASAYWATRVGVGWWNGDLIFIARNAERNMLTEQLSQHVAKLQLEVTKRLFNSDADTEGFVHAFLS